MKGNVGRVIEALVLAVVGLALLGTVLDFTNEAQSHPNITSTQTALVSLIPVFYVIGLVVAIIFLLIGRFCMTGGKGKMF